MTLYSTGIRCEELAHLAIGDIHSKRNPVRALVQSKGPSHSTIFKKIDQVLANLPALDKD